MGTILADISSNRRLPGINSQDLISSSQQSRWGEFMPGNRRFEEMSAKIVSTSSIITVDRALQILVLLSLAFTILDKILSQSSNVCFKPLNSVGLMLSAACHTKIRSNILAFRCCTVVSQLKALSTKLG